jgi:hypothetical protein
MASNLREAPSSSVNGWKNLRGQMYDLKGSERGGTRCTVGLKCIKLEGRRDRDGFIAQHSTEQRGMARQGMAWHFC